MSFSPSKKNRHGNGCRQRPNSYNLPAEVFESSNSNMKGNRKPKLQTIFVSRLALTNELCVGTQRSLCRGPALLCVGLLRSAAVSVSGLGGLCRAPALSIGARRSLCRSPVPSVGPRAAVSEELRDFPQCGHAPSALQILVLSCVRMLPVACGSSPLGDLRSVSYNCCPGTRARWTFGLSFKAIGAIPR